MALVLNDRVQETCSSPGTGAVTLLGAVNGFQSFASGVGDGNTCYYCIADQGGTNWEVGLGTYSSSGNTLTRTTPYSGSSATPVNFNSGTQSVFVTYPAEKKVILDAANNATALGTVSSGTWQGSTIGVAYGGTGVTTSTGTGNVVLSDSPALVTPNLGTPSAVNLTNGSALPLTTGVSGILPTANGGTNLSSFTSGGVFYASSTSAMANGTGFTYDGSNALLGTTTNFSSTDSAGAIASTGMAIYPFSLSSGTTNTAIRSSVLSHGAGAANDGTKRFYGFVAAPQLSYSSATGAAASGGIHIAPAILSSTSTARVNVAGINIDVTRNNPNDVTTSTFGTTQGINCSVSTSTGLPSTTKVPSLRGISATATVGAGIVVNTVGISASASNFLATQGGTLSQVAGVSSSAYFVYAGSTSTPATLNGIANVISGDTSVSLNSTTDTGSLTVSSAASYKGTAVSITNNSTVTSLNVTNAYGLYFGGIQAYRQGGGSSSLTITNAYGLYLGDNTTSGGATITNRWGIYQSDTPSKNYFGGNVLIGNTTGTSPLTVTGVVESTAGGFKFPDGTTQTTAATAGLTQAKATGLNFIFGL